MPSDGTWSFAHGSRQGTARTPKAGSRSVAGREQGREQGRAQALAKALRLLLANRDTPLTPEQRNRIETCTNPEQLERWLERALRTTNLAEILSD